MSLSSIGCARELGFLCRLHINLDGFAIQRCIDENFVEQTNVPIHVVQFNQKFEAIWSENSADLAVVSESSIEVYSVKQNADGSASWCATFKIDVPRNFLNGYALSFSFPLVLAEHIRPSGENPPNCSELIVINLVANFFQSFTTSCPPHYIGSAGLNKLSFSGRYLSSYQYLNPDNTTIGLRVYDLFDLWIMRRPGRMSSSLDFKFADLPLGSLAVIVKEQIKGNNNDTDSIAAIEDDMVQLQWRSSDREGMGEDGRELFMVHGQRQGKERSRPSSQHCVRLYSCSQQLDTHSTSIMTMAFHAAMVANQLHNNQHGMSSSTANNHFPPPVYTIAIHYLMEVTLSDLLREIGSLSKENREGEERDVSDCTFHWIEDSLSCASASAAHSAHHHKQHLCAMREQQRWQQHEDETTSVPPPPSLQHSHSHASASQGTHYSSSPTHNSHKQLVSSSSSGRKALVHTHSSSNVINAAGVGGHMDSGGSAPAAALWLTVCYSSLFSCDSVTKECSHSCIVFGISHMGGRYAVSCTNREPLMLIEQQGNIAPSLQHYLSPCLTRCLADFHDVVPAPPSISPPSSTSTRTGQVLQALSIVREYVVHAHEQNSAAVEKKENDSPSTTLLHMSSFLTSFPPVDHDNKDVVSSTPKIDFHSLQQSFSYANRIHDSVSPNERKDDIMGGISLIADQLLPSSTVSFLPLYPCEGRYLYEVKYLDEHKNESIVRTNGRSEWVDFSALLASSSPDSRQQTSQRPTIRLLSVQIRRPKTGKTGTRQLVVLYSAHDDNNINEAARESDCRYKLAVFALNTHDHMGEKVVERTEQLQEAGKNESILAYSLSSVWKERGDGEEGEPTSSATPLNKPNNATLVKQTSSSTSDTTSSSLSSNANHSTSTFSLEITPDPTYGLGMRLNVLLVPHDQGQEQHEEAGRKSTEKKADKGNTDEQHQQGTSHMEYRTYISSFKLHPDTNQQMSAECTGLLQVNDEIVAINGTLLRGLPINDVISMIRNIIAETCNKNRGGGKIGSPAAAAEGTLILTIQRDAHGPAARLANGVSGTSVSDTASPRKESHISQWTPQGKARYFPSPASSVTKMEPPRGVVGSGNHKNDSPSHSLPPPHVPWRIQEWQYIRSIEVQVQQNHLLSSQASSENLIEYDPAAAAAETAKTDKRVDIVSADMLVEGKDKVIYVAVCVMVGSAKSGSNNDNQLAAQSPMISVGLLCSDEEDGDRIESWSDFTLQRMGSLVSVVPTGSASSGLFAASFTLQVWKRSSSSHNIQCQEGECSLLVTSSRAADHNKAGRRESCSTLPCFPVQQCYWFTLNTEVDEGVAPRYCVSAMDVIPVSTSGARKMLQVTQQDHLHHSGERSAFWLAGAPWTNNRPVREEIQLMSTISQRNAEGEGEDSGIKVSVRPRAHCPQDEASPAGSSAYQLIVPLFASSISSFVNVNLSGRVRELCRLMNLTPSSSVSSVLSPVDGPLTSLYSTLYLSSVTNLHELNVYGQQAFILLLMHAQRMHKERSKYGSKITPSAPPATQLPASIVANLFFAGPRHTETQKRLEQEGEGESTDSVHLSFLKALLPDINAAVPTTSMEQSSAVRLGLDSLTVETHPSATAPSSLKSQTWQERLAAAWTPLHTFSSVTAASTDILYYLTSHLFLPFWMHEYPLKEILEIINRHALSCFKQNKSSMEIFLEFVLLNKVDILTQFAKTDRDKSGRQLVNLLKMIETGGVKDIGDMGVHSKQYPETGTQSQERVSVYHESSKDFRKTMHKNAFALMKLGKYKQSAAVFLLASPPYIKEAVNVLCNQYKSPALAWLVMRLLAERERENLKETTSSVSPNSQSTSEDPSSRPQSLRLTSFNLNHHNRPHLSTAASGNNIVDALLDRGYISSGEGSSRHGSHHHNHFAQSPSGDSSAHSLSLAALSPTRSPAAGPRCTAGIGAGIASLGAPSALDPPQTLLPPRGHVPLHLTATGVAAAAALPGGDNYFSYNNSGETTPAGSSVGPGTPAHLHTYSNTPRHPQHHHLQMPRGVSGNNAGIGMGSEGARSGYSSSANLAELQNGQQNGRTNQQISSSPSALLFSPNGSLLSELNKQIINEYVIPDLVRACGASALRSRQLEQESDIGKGNSAVATSSPMELSTSLPSSQSPRLDHVSSLMLLLLASLWTQDRSQLQRYCKEWMHPHWLVDAATPAGCDVKCSDDDMGDEQVDRDAVSNAEGIIGSLPFLRVVTAFVGRESLHTLLAAQQEYFLHCGLFAETATDNTKKAELYCSIRAELGTNNPFFVRCVQVHRQHHLEVEMRERAEQERLVWEALARSNLSEADSPMSNIGEGNGIQEENNTEENDSTPSAAQPAKAGGGFNFSGLGTADKKTASSRALPVRSMLDDFDVQTAGVAPAVSTPVTPSAAGVSAQNEVLQQSPTPTPNIATERSSARGGDVFDMQPQRHSRRVFTPVATTTPPPARSMLDDDLSSFEPPQRQARPVVRGNESTGSVNTLTSGANTPKIISSQSLHTPAALSPPVPVPATTSAVPPPRDPFDVFDMAPPRHTRAQRGATAASIGSSTNTSGASVSLRTPVTATVAPVTTDDSQAMSQPLSNKEGESKRQEPRSALDGFHAPQSATNRQGGNQHSSNHSNSSSALDAFDFAPPQRHTRASRPGTSSTPSTSSVSPVIRSESQGDTPHSDKGNIVSSPTATPPVPVDPFDMFDMQPQRHYRK